MSLSSSTSDSKFHACPVVSTHPVWRFWKCKHSGGKSLEPDLPQILLRVIARTDNSETLADWNQHDDSCHRASERHWDTENICKSNTPKICNQPGSLRLQTSQGTVGHSRARWLSRMFTVSLSTKTIKDTKDKVLMQMSKFSRQASTSLELSESDRAEGSLH